VVEGSRRLEGKLAGDWSARQNPRLIAPIPVRFPRTPSGDPPPAPLTTIARSRPGSDAPSSTSLKGPPDNTERTHLPSCARRERPQTRRPAASAALDELGVAHCRVASPVVPSCPPIAAHFHGEEVGVRTGATALDRTPTSVRAALPGRWHSSGRTRVGPPDRSGGPNDDQRAPSGVIPACWRIATDPPTSPRIVASSPAGAYHRVLLRLMWPRLSDGLSAAPRARFRSPQVKNQPCLHNPLLDLGEAVVDLIEAARLADDPGPPERV
jgi:hypothetical protein